VLAPGDLIQASGDPEVDIVDQSCQRRHVPNADTLAQIEQTYHVAVTQISQTNWQRVPAGSDVPDYDTDQENFQFLMQEIFGTSSTSATMAPPPRRAQVKVVGQAAPVVGTAI
jgi:hypothetical protein